MSGLERLLRPQSIAAIGGLQAARVVEQCELMGYQGDIWPVHPSKSEVHGLPVFQSVADLPGSPDAAFVGVNRQLTIDVVRALSARHCGGAICYASGFLESDEAGGKLQATLINAAGEMPVVGPNCYGLINYADGALLWPDQQGGIRLPEGESGVAIIAQSSNIAINFTMQRRGLPLAYVLTVGNQALVGMSDLALTILDDPRVSALGIYVEGFDSIEALQRLAHKSRKLNKPIVIYKVGKSLQSQKSAMSHTASLVGSHAITSAFLRRSGIGQAESIPVFLETLKLLHLHGPLSSYRLSSMSCSGGEASIIADAAETRRVYFPELNDIEKKDIQIALGPLVTVDNPLDYQTYCWGNREVMQAAYAALIQNGFALNLLIIDFPHSSRCKDWEWMIAVDAFEAALTMHNAKGALVVGMPENIAESYIVSFRERGIVSFLGIDEALTASEIAADIGAAWKRPEQGDFLSLASVTGKHVTLDEASAKQALRGYGVGIPAGGPVKSISTATELACQLGYPLALKALGIAHKTELNALRLGLQSETAVEQAAGELFDLGDSLYLESMISDPLAELIVGITRDVQFGLVLTIGSGGILVEILQDSTTLIIPASRSVIETALMQLKMAPLLQGYRGKPKADIEATIDNILSIQDYAIAQSQNLVELDVNPLLICAQGEGAFAADALIVLQESPNE